MTEPKPEKKETGPISNAKMQPNKQTLTLTFLQTFIFIHSQTVFLFFFSSFLPTCLFIFIHSFIHSFETYNIFIHSFYWFVVRYLIKSYNPNPARVDCLQNRFHSTILTRPSWG